MIRAALLGAVSCLVAGPALALSCMAPDVARSFEEARAAEEVYSVVLGRFEFEGRSGGAASVPAVFDGRVLGPDGFVTEARRPVTLRISCAASWCGEIAPGVETLAFIEQGEDGLLVDVAPCPQWVFPDPSPDQVNRAVACMTGECR